MVFTSPCVQEDVFRAVVSASTWRNVLSEADREKLAKLLPPGTHQEKEEELR